MGIVDLSTGEERRLNADELRAMAAQMPTQTLIQKNQTPNQSLTGVIQRKIARKSYFSKVRTITKELWILRSPRKIPKTIMSLRTSFALKMMMGNQVINKH